MPMSGNIFPLIELILVRRPVAARISLSFSSVNSENSKYSLKSEVDQNRNHGILRDQNRPNHGAANGSQTAAIALKTPPHGSQSAVNRQSIGAYGAGKWQSDGKRNRTQNAVKRAVKRQSIGAYSQGCKTPPMAGQSAVKRRLGAGKWQSDRRAYRAQNVVKRQSVGSQSAANRRLRLRGCKCQSDDKRNRAQNVVKRQVGRQMAVNRRLRGRQMSVR